jgi:hypothetical protein
MRTSRTEHRVLLSNCMNLVYLKVCGEVAEWPKAAVC